MSGKSIEKREKSGKDRKKQEAGGVTMTYTVAECGEFHSMGRYYEGIRTLEEAAALYRKMQGGDGIPSIGINLHVEGTEKWMDSQLDVVTGEGIDMGMVRLVPEFCNCAQAREAVEAMIAMFPEKEVLEL